MFRWKRLKAARRGSGKKGWLASKKRPLPPPAFDQPSEDPPSQQQRQQQQPSELAKPADPVQANSQEERQARTTAFGLSLGSDMEGPPEGFSNWAPKRGTGVHVLLADASGGQPAFVKQVRSQKVVWVRGRDGGVAVNRAIAMAHMVARTKSPVSLEQASVVYTLRVPRHAMDDKWASKVMGEDETRALVKAGGFDLGSTFLRAAPTLPDEGVFLRTGVASEYMERRRSPTSWEANALANISSVVEMQLYVAQVWLVDRSRASDAEARLGRLLASQPGFVDVSSRRNLSASGSQSATAPWHFSCPAGWEFPDEGFAP